MRGSSSTSAVNERGALDDRDLVERARTDRQAFAELYRCHVNAVFTFAFRRCGSRDVAEEATSATFEQALRGINSFEWRPTGLRPWLYRIASNEVANVYRRRAVAGGVRGQRAMRDLVAADASSPTPSEIDADLGALHAAINALPVRYRDVITLRYLSELTADEAATALGCSKPVLAVTLHRALSALRKKMEAVDREVQR